jgi:hypothetical protein
MNRRTPAWLCAGPADLGCADPLRAGGGVSRPQGAGLRLGRTLRGGRLWRGADAQDPKGAGGRADVRVRDFLLFAAGSRAYFPL